jgi:hypothetical protein
MNGATTKILKKWALILDPHVNFYDKAVRPLYISLPPKDKAKMITEARNTVRFAELGIQDVGAPIPKLADGVKS